MKDELRKFYELKAKVDELAEKMGLGLTYTSILLEDGEPKLALVFAVKPEAFLSQEALTQVKFDREFESIMKADAEPEIPQEIVDEILEFLDSDDEEV